MWLCLRAAFATTVLAVGVLHAQSPKPPIEGASDPAPQTFEVTRGTPPDGSKKTYGMVGGGGWYHGKVTLAPHYEFPSPGVLRVSLAGDHGTVTELEHLKPGGLAILNWEFGMMDLGAAKSIVETRAVFNTGTVALKGGREILDFNIPAGASRLERLEFNWAWEGNKQSLVFEGAGWGIWPLVGGLGALGGAAAWLLRKRSKKRRPDEQVTVRIVSPADQTCQPCGRAIPLTAVLVPPGRESEIRWLVPGDQQQDVSSGQGAQFAVTYSDTGVKQVIAECEGMRDDVILYAFRTASGGLSLADVLSCEAPRLPNSEADYTQYRNRDGLAQNLAKRVEA